MPLSSRDIVQQSLAFASPPRIPYAMGNDFPSDFRIVSRKPAPFGGGFIAGYYGSNLALGLAPEYQETAARTYMEHGLNPWLRRATSA